MSKKCILAYTAMYVDPDGSVRPCCISKPFKERLNWNDHNSVEGIYNSKQFKELRKSMEDGNPSDICDICYKGGNFLKDVWNERWKSKLNDPNLYDKDFNIKGLHHLDARFSNLCNFKCRMCGPGLSSSWYEDFKAILPEHGENWIKSMEKIDPDPVDKFTAKDLQNIEHMNVGGGEPFITADFFKLLDRFDEEQASNISIYINTNLSNLKYKGESVLDKLTKFKDVVLGCSCDGYGEIGEYQRTGFNSDRFFNNLKQLTAFCKDHPNIKPSVEFTITTMNVFHIYDFIEYIVTTTDLDYEGVHMHWASTPYYFAPILAPEPLKNRIKEYIKEGLDNTEYSDLIKVKLKEFYDHLHLDPEPTRNISDYEVDIKHWIDTMDELRGNSYKDICPWVEEIFTIK
jgi:organic radical activating enzyme